MINFLSTDDTVSEKYNPILEPLAEQYKPTQVQVLDSHHSVNGQALVSNINIPKQSKDNKQPKNRRAVIIFLKKKDLMPLTQKNSSHTTILKIGIQVVRSLFMTGRL